MTAMPTTVKDLETFIGESDLSTFFDEEGKALPAFSEIVENYTKAYMAREATMADQVKEQVQTVMADLLSDAQGSQPTKIDLRPGSNVSRAARRSAPGSLLDEVWDDHGEFLQAVYHGHESFQNSKDLDAKLVRAREIQNSYGTNVPSDGGFLLPEEFRQAILSPALEEGITRPYAMVIPMSTASLSLPAVDETTHASGSLFGGVICYWTAEDANMTETSAKFGKIKLEPQDLTAYARVPNQLITDAPAFLAWFMANMPAAVAWSEDYAFVSGNGADRPLGWATAGNPATVSITKESGQEADTIYWQNIVKMYARMLPTSQGRAVWFANTDTFPELSTMALSVGTGGSPVWLNNGVEGPPARILGRPVRFSEKLPTLGDAGDIMYNDLQYYGIGDRQMAMLESSRDYLFKSNETAYRLVQRVDGRPLLLSALTPVNSSDTLSAFVKIAERA